jgi:hypothetical protein
VLSNLYPLYISVDAEFSFVMDIHTSLIAVLTLLYISILSILPICCHCCLPHSQNLDIREQQTVEYERDRLLRGDSDIELPLAFFFAFGVLEGWNLYVLGQEEEPSCPLDKLITNGVIWW